MRKAVPFLLVLVLAIVLLLVRRYDKDIANKTNTNTFNRARGFDRRAAYLEYTHHAKCRMKCRQISQAEVKEIMLTGKINYNKSEAKGRPCPTYALEGVTADKQRVRIVYAQCNDKTKVVTVIDLNTEWECDCPGDDKKFKNRN